jgi:cytochrome P450
MSATTLKTAMESASSAETPIPTGVQLTPFNGTFLNDPYHVLKRLRDAEPIHRDNALSRWFVTGFDNVREVLRFPNLSLVEQEFDYRPVPTLRALKQLWVSRE